KHPDSRRRYVAPQYFFRQVISPEPIGLLDRDRQPTRFPCPCDRTTRDGGVPVPNPDGKRSRRLPMQTLNRKNLHPLPRYLQPRWDRLGLRVSPSRDVAQGACPAARITNSRCCGRCLSYWNSPAAWVWPHQENRHKHLQPRHCRHHRTKNDFHREASAEI